MQEKFHQYHLVKELASKYSHSTYLASLTKKPEHQVVLIVFDSSLSSSPSECEKLLQKAKRIKKLKYPYFVPILDMGREEEQFFVVREYLPNGSLRSRLKEISPHRLGLHESLTIVSRVGEALAYAHQHHIFHGNLKPENILFDASGQPVLTDFYLPSGKDTLICDQATDDYAFCYLAPEQLAGICDARSDQYALGCLTYELITGHVPFAEQNYGSLVNYPSEAQLAPLSASVPDLPSSLEAAVFKTLAKDPDERFFDFSLFLDVVRFIVSPPPAFPLSSPDDSYRKKSISHYLKLEEEEDITSSVIDSSASLSFASQAPELFPVVKTIEDDIPEMVDDSLVIEATPPGVVSGINLPEEKSPFAVQTTGTFWITNSLVKWGVKKPPIKVSVSSVRQQNEDATTEMTSSSWNMTLSLTRKSIVHTLSTGLVWRGSRKRLGLVLFCLVIITFLSAYASYLPFRISRSDSLTYPTQVATQAFISAFGTLPIPIPTPTVQQPTVVVWSTPTPTPKATPLPTPTSTPKSTPTPAPIPFVTISLSSYINNKGIGSAPGQANLDGSGYSLPADQLPKARQVTLNSVPYLFPGSSSGASDNVVALGQTITIPQGNYQRAFLLVTSTWGSSNGVITINYTDGSTSSVSLEVPDWLAGPSGIVSTSYRYSPTGADQNVSYIYGVRIGIDGTRVASSLTLPSTAQPSSQQVSLHVFALTLQHV
jgi:serine/threonine protein kinase